MAVERRRVAVLQAEAQRPSEVHRAAGHVEASDHTRSYLSQLVDLSLFSGIAIVQS